MKIKIDFSSADFAKSRIGFTIDNNYISLDKKLFKLTEFQDFINGKSDSKLYMHRTEKFMYIFIIHNNSLIIHSIHVRTTENLFFIEDRYFDLFKKKCNKYLFCPKLFTYKDMSIEKIGNKIINYRLSTCSERNFENSKYSIYYQRSNNTMLFTYVDYGESDFEVRIKKEFNIYKLTGMELLSSKNTLNVRDSVNLMNFTIKFDDDKVKKDFYMGKDIEYIYVENNTTLIQKNGLVSIKKDNERSTLKIELPLSMSEKLRRKFEIKI